MFSSKIITSSQYGDVSRDLEEFNKRKLNEKGPIVDDKKSTEAKLSSYTSLNRSATPFFTAHQDTTTEDCAAALSSLKLNN